MQHEQHPERRETSEHGPDEVVARALGERGRTEQHDAGAGEREHDPVREQVVLEVDDREREQRGGEHEVRGEGPRVEEGVADRRPRARRTRSRPSGSGSGSARRSCGTCPRSTSHENTGTLSRGEIGVSHSGQCDGGATIDSWRGHAPDDDVEEGADSEAEDHADDDHEGVASLEKLRLDQRLGLNSCFQDDRLPRHQLPPYQAEAHVGAVPDCTGRWQSFPA